MALPRFTPDGLLPPGDHTQTIDELRQSYLVTGEGLEVPGWDSAWRAQLVDNLEPFIRQLWQVGVERIFVNGSFVTSQPHPGDIDAYFECELGRLDWLVVELLQLEPVLPWDWAHWPIDPVTTLPKLRIWHRYRVDLFAHSVDRPVPTGIKDEFGYDLFFPSLFRRDRLTSRPKGVIQLKRE